MQEEMLLIKDLCKSYGENVVVHGFDLSLSEGELFGLAGPADAGKSTVLKMIAGLETPDRGLIQIDRMDAWAHRETINGTMGYMPEKFGKYDAISVSEYLEYYAALFGITGSENSKRCAELLEFVNLSSMAAENVNLLSIGMKKRLALARTLVNNPTFLLLDSPIYGQDVKESYEMKEMLKRLHNKKITMIITANALSQISDICTSLGILTHGKLQVCGSIDTITKQVNNQNPLVVQCIQQKEKAVSILKACPEVLQISIDEKKIIAGYSGTNKQQAELLAKMLHAGVDVYSFSRQVGSLESIYYNITGKREVLSL